MPNYVENKLLITGPGEVLAEIYQCHCVGEERKFDFNTLIPMPVSLDISSTTVNIPLIQFLTKNPTVDFKKWVDYPDNLKRIKLGLLVNGEKDSLEIMDEFSTVGYLIEALALTKNQMQNQKNYGHTDWYSWSNHNWDTKWNAQEGSSYLTDSALSISFDTAWSCPLPVILELAELYPEVEIEYKYLDEGRAFGGFTYYKNGKVLKEAPAADVMSFGKEHFRQKNEDNEDEEY